MTIACVVFLKCIFRFIIKGDYYINNLILFLIINYQ